MSFDMDTLTNLKRCCQVYASHYWSGKEGGYRANLFLRHFEFTSLL
jgi:hypothetical protein